MADINARANRQDDETKVTLAKLKLETEKVKAGARPDKAPVEERLSPAALPQAATQSPGSVIGDIGGVAERFGQRLGGKAVSKTRQEELRDKQFKQQELQMRKQNFRMNVVKNLSPQIKQAVKSGATQEELENIISQVDNGIVPGIRDDLQTKIEILQTEDEQSLASIETIIESNGLALATMGIDSFRQARNLLESNPGMMKVFIKNTDDILMPRAADKLGELKKLQAANVIPEDFDFNDFLSMRDDLPQFLKGEQLQNIPTDQEISSMERNRDKLSPFGISTLGTLEALDQKRLLSGLDKSTRPLAASQRDRADLEDKLANETDPDERKKIQRSLKETQAGIDKSLAPTPGKTEFDQTPAQQKIVEEQSQKRIAVKTLVRETSNAIKAVEDDPAITATFGGGLATLIGSLEANISAVANLSGVDMSEVTSFNGIDEKEFFGALAGKSAAFKTLTYNLAVMSALAKQKNQRLSDFDVKSEIRALGASADDPDQVIASMKESRRFTVDNFRTEITDRAKAAGKPLSEVDRDALATFEKAMREENQFTLMGDEEFTALLNNKVKLKALSLDDMKALREERNKRAGK